MTNHDTGKVDAKKARIIVGDCLEVLKGFESDSIDSLVTDPPAGIGFMGKEWDHHKGGRSEWVAWMTGVMRECHRVMKPGAHGLVWAIPRTSHWTATALEDAGFEIRDQIFHLFGQGFPKSLDISKAIDKAAGARRETVATRQLTGKARVLKGGNFDGDYEGKEVTAEYAITAPATDAAKKWQGFGTALKPAVEVWILVRKPISEKNVAANVLKHGVGGINIDGCRIEASERPHVVSDRRSGNVSYGDGLQGSKSIGFTTQGRFPANLVLSHSPHCTDEQCDIECAIAMLDEQSLAGGMHSAGRARDKQMVKKGGNPSFEIKGPHNMRRLGDSGGASRFFFNSRYSEEECSQSSASSVSEISSLDLNLDGFAQKLAAIADLPEEIASSDLLAAFTVAIQSGLKQKSARNIEAILNTGARCLREFRLTSISNNNPVSLAATQRLTDIITTTLSPLTCSGSADRATSGTTPPNLERGAKDSANRFIYCAKISSSERNAGLEGMPERRGGGMSGTLDGTLKTGSGNERNSLMKNHHPTVKPQKLMRYLCKLVTPPGGLVLDPFMGSGSTGLAALSEGFRFIGIEREPEYFEIAEKRIFNHFPEVFKEKLAQKKVRP